MLRFTILPLSNLTVLKVVGIWIFKVHFIIFILLIISGGVGLVYVGQPLDTIKVKMQTFPNLYRGMVDCFRQTLMKEGITKGLYAGTLPAVVANVAENSVLFAAYGTCQKAMMMMTRKEVHT